MAYETLWLLRGASEAPLKYQGRSLFRPHVTKSYFETYKSYDHMQKFGPKIKKFEQDFRISKFCKIEILHHLDKRKIALTCLILKIQSSIVY